MPQVFTYVFAYAASSAGISIGSTALTVAGYVATVAAVAGIGNHQRRKAQAAARAAFNANLQDRLVMTSVVSGPRSRVYGRVRNVDGILFKATRGENSQFYTLVVAVAGHEVDAIEDVYFGDQLVTLDGNGYVQTTPYALERRSSESTEINLDGSGAGTVTVTGTLVAGSAAAVQRSSGNIDERFDKPLNVSVSGNLLTISGGDAGSVASVSWQATSMTPKARVRKYLGGAGQDLSTVLQPLFPDLITSAHKFAGIACLIVDLEYDTDAWPSGVPSISAVVRGARVFDPRTNTTAWTENPALIARDWALYANGGACSTGDLAAASFTAAANACDVTHAFVTGSGTTTLPLYTCGTVLRTDADPTDGLAEIVESMAGKAGWAGGQLRIVAGVSRSAVATITEDWLTEEAEIQIVPEPAADEAVNIYRPTIADADQNYVALPSPEVRATSYITADGRELPREITLGGVTDAIHAQHVCGVLMRDARNGLTVTLPCNMRAYQLELFDVVEVTLARFGWTAKTFEVIDWQFSVAGGITLTLKETAAAIFQPDASFAELDLTPNTQLPDPAVVETPTGLTVSTSVPELVDGQPVVRALVEWDALADAGVLEGGSVEIQYLEIGSNYGWQSVKAAGDQTEHVLPVLQAGSSYLFRSRSINALGVRSDWSVQTVIVTSAAPKIEASGLAVGAVSARVEAEKAVKLTAFAAGIEPVTVVAGSTLPTTKSTEAIVLTGTGKLYRWDGSAYTAAVPTSDLSGTISEAQIAANAVSVAKFASGIEPVTVVASVPSSLSTRSIFNITDAKLYRWNGSAYIAAVPATDISGTLADAQIAALSASKISGQLNDVQLAAIAAAKVTGTLNASQLAVQIGGGNLLPNAAFKNTTQNPGLIPDGWAIYNNGGISYTTAVGAGGLFGTNFFRITSSASTTQTLGIFTRGAGSTDSGGVAGGVVSWVPGQTYVISFWSRAAGSLAAGFHMQGLNSNMAWTASTQLENPALINGTWQRYSWRVSPADNANTPAGELYISWDVSGTLPSGAAIDICAPQVEFGEIATAFAPRTSEILPSTITVTEIADNAVTTPKLIAGAVVAGKIAANAISATEIQSGAITTAKLAAGAVTANEIAANTITGGKIATGTITATELAAGSVTTAKIAAGAVTATEIAAATITGGKIAAGTITGSNIAADTITAGQIATGAISADEIAAGAITTDKLAANSVTAAKIAAATITATEIASGAITTAKLAAGAVTANEIAANTITSGKIAAGAISTTELAANAVTTAKLAAGSVTATEIASGTITADRMVTGLLSSDNVLTRGLTVRDNSGNVIFGVGTNLDWSRISSQPSGIYNSNITVTLGSNGAISASGGPSASGAVTFSGLGTTGAVGSGNLAANGDFLLSTSGVPTHFLNYNNAGVTVTNTINSGGPIQNSNYWRINVGSTGSTTFGWHFYTAASCFGGWKANTNYIVSFYARCSAYAGATFGNTWNQSPAVSTALQNPGLSTSWQRYVWLINFGNNAIDSNGFWTISEENLAVGTNLDFACIQVEQGDAPSGWAPAPVSSLNQITSTNISTYIASAAISWAYIGNLDISTAGAIKSGKTSYSDDSNSGWWIGMDSTTPKFKFGNSTQYIRWTGSALEIGGQVVTNSNLAGSISADKLSLGTITVSFSPSSVTATVYSADEQSYTSVTASASGGASPYTYRFALESYVADYTSGSRPYVNIYDVDGGTVTLRGAQPLDSQQTVDLICVVTDANGRTGTGVCGFQITYGDPP